MKSVAEQIFENSELTDEGCWEWTRSTDSKGYGYFGIKGKICRVHRVSYEEFVGPIPDGMTIDHLCRNTKCINPEHLEICTRSENVKRMREAVPHYNDLKTHCLRGHEFSEENTRYYRGKRCCRTCERMHHKNYRKVNV